LALPSTPFELLLREADFGLSLERLGRDRALLAAFGFRAALEPAPPDAAVLLEAFAFLVVV
jgi:hypothetical protein